MKAHFLCPSSYHFDINPKKKRPCFADIREVVHEKEKQELAFHIAEWSIGMCIGMPPLVFSTDVYSREMTRKVCYNLPHDDAP